MWVETMVQTTSLLRLLREIEFKIMSGYPTDLSISE
jgi:hypothetical protein